MTFNVIQASSANSIQQLKQELILGVSNELNCIPSDLQLTLIKNMWYQPFEPVRTLVTVYFEVDDYRNGSYSQNYFTYKVYYNNETNIYSFYSWASSATSTNSGLSTDQLSELTLFYPDPSCFNEGTKILCLNKKLEEEYIPIENLRKGDLVKSFLHGYRKIDLIGKNTMINNPDKFSKCMYKMEKTDLIITGWHSILVDDLGEHKEENDKRFGGSSQIIDNKHLLLSSISKDFVKLENNDVYTYYHFILENNGNDENRFGVWANGVLTETPSKTHFIKHNYILL
jgi:hypothetical protein